MAARAYATKWHKGSPMLGQGRQTDILFVKTGNTFAHLLYGDHCLVTQASEAVECVGRILEVQEETWI